MTISEISQKLFKSNIKQYGLFFFSITFSIAMTGAYGILQYSPTVTNVLIDGGSTQVISQAMFFGSLIGIIVFLIYADSLFLKYKSKEIGIFLSLGINRHSVQKIIVKEYNLLFQIAAIIGLIFSIPLAYLCWQLLNIFLETQETKFSIGWIGWLIALTFALTSWMILRTINCKYIKNIAILKILKASDENEESKSGSLLKLFTGGLFIPIGIITFFTLQNIRGFLNTLFAFMGLVVATVGVYLLIIQCASFGDILKKYNIKAYYRNIVFYNLLKKKIRQYTLSIFVATLLITFTVFGIGFIAAGFIDGYNVALNEPYDYMINTTCDYPITEQEILRIAKENDTIIKDLKYVESLLVGVQNNYKDGSTDWGSRIVVSQSNFNTLSEANISIPPSSYLVYYDSSMGYRLNAFSTSSTLFFNPTTNQEFYLSQELPICRDGLFNTRSFFSTFLVINDKDYMVISDSLEDKYKAISYMVNVEDWQHTTTFQNAILNTVITDRNGKIFTNWHNSATFSKTGSKADYLTYKDNETRIARTWSLYPLSKLSSTTTQFEAFSTYLMLLLFIALIAFVSAVMVIGLKLVSTIWDDSTVYENLKRLGMTQSKVIKLVTKQMIFVYFIPTVLGCLIGAFTCYRIMLVSDVTYISQTMRLISCVCVLIFVIQLIIFFLLRLQVIHKVSAN